MGKGPCSAASSSAGAGAAAAFWGAADDDMGPLAVTGGDEGRWFGCWFWVQKGSSKAAKIYAGLPLPLPSLGRLGENVGGAHNSDNWCLAE